MNPKWRDYVMGLAFFALAFTLLTFARCTQAATLGPLSSAQKAALVQAWRIGDAYGLGDTFAAIVYVESSACARKTGDHGLAHGCAQVHASAARHVFGVELPGHVLMRDAVSMAAGAAYLADCVARYGLRAGIGCYTVGLPRAAKLGRQRLAALSYTRNVLAVVQELQQIGVSYD